DLYLYYDPDHPRWYKRPDWFAVLGVPRAHPKDPLRCSYVTWEERVLPYVVVELVSHTDPDPDQGEPPESAEGMDKPPNKWAVYERSLGIPFYLIHDRFKDKLRCYTLEGGRYRDTTPTDRRVWLPAAGLGIGVWEGTFKGAQLSWLRGFDAAGQWLPTGEERELRQRRQIERANRRAELQSRRTELESRRADQEGQRADQEGRR
ncbi:MAG: Uma2 family endonuclease, partial [bacterium]|nr:Uma2 family endonuclease [bacterium]